MHRADNPSVLSRRMDIVFAQAARKGIEPLSLRVCNPHGNGDSIHNYLVKLEATTVSAMAAGHPCSFQICTTDKARQNAINSLGGYSGAGDAAMAAHWKVARMAAAILTFANGSDCAELIRVTPMSDEGILLMAGKHLSHGSDEGFGNAWTYAKHNVHLTDYKYVLDVPHNGSTKHFELDLEAFSRVLRHPEMVLSCNYSISQPKHIGLASGGFIAERIGHLENKEAPSFRHLPASFKVGNGGLAEVITPFDSSLADLGTARRKSGTYVEIKLEAEKNEALKLLRFVHDSDHAWGTRKGYSEIYSGVFGMRGLNTFLGKARANSILTPICHAMHDVAKNANAAVLPLNGSYLQYWVDLQPDEAARALITKAVNKRIHAADERDCRHINVDFQPAITMIGASGVELSEVKPKFILESMEKSGMHAQILGMSDFILNFMENINRDVQKGIYDKMARKENGGTPIHQSDLEHIAAIRYICAHRRTVRNTEDLVWILRRDETLPPEIRQRRTEIESWLFEFAAARFESIPYLLAQRIMTEMKNRSVRAQLFV